MADCGKRRYGGSTSEITGADFYYHQRIVHWRPRPASGHYAGPCAEGDAGRRKRRTVPGPRLIHHLAAAAEYNVRRSAITVDASPATALGQTEYNAASTQQSAIDK